MSLTLVPVAAELDAEVGELIVPEPLASGAKSSHRRAE
jgi:hypothetical protein